MKCSLAIGLPGQTATIQYALSLLCQTQHFVSPVWESHLSHPDRCLCTVLITVMIILSQLSHVSILILRMCVTCEHDSDKGVCNVEGTPEDVSICEVGVHHDQRGTSPDNLVKREAVSPQ